MLWESSKSTIRSAILANRVLWCDWFMCRSCSICLQRTEHSNTKIVSCTSKYGVPKRTKLFFARADLIFLNFARADLIHFISRARIIFILFRARGCQYMAKLFQLRFTIQLFLWRYVLLQFLQLNHNQNQNFKFLKMEERGIRPWRKVARNFS